MEARSPGWGLLVALLFAAHCAAPGRPYVVAPAIGGYVHGDLAQADAPRLRLSIIHRENPALHDRREAALFPDREFYFDELQLVIAGHEYSKVYRVFLHLEVAGRDRVIWRADLSRRALAGLIQLDCDLDRPEAHGQPCWVDHPLQHPWLIEEGERTFERLCAACHGIGGAGVESTHEPIAAAPPDLRRIAARRGGTFDRSRIAEWIEGRSLPTAHGTRSMPIWGERLSEQYERYAEGDALIGATLDPVLAYLESIQTRDGLP